MEKEALAAGASAARMKIRPVQIEGLGLDHSVRWKAGLEAGLAQLPSEMAAAGLEGSEDLVEAGLAGLQESKLNLS